VKDPWDFDWPVPDDGGGRDPKSIGPDTFIDFKLNCAVLQPCCIDGQGRGRSVPPNMPLTSALIGFSLLVSASFCRRRDGD